MKKFREEGPWAYPGTPQFLGVTPIMSGTGKATDFKFGRYIDRVYVNKSPLKTSGAFAICVVRESCTFLVTHTLGASRDYLCDSTAFLYYIVFDARIFYKKSKLLAHVFSVCVTPKMPAVCSPISRMADRTVIHQ